MTTHETVSLPVILYKCEIWAFTLRSESRLMVYENEVLRKIFGAYKKVAGEWRKH
jgi:hypothetical protein